jgi:hypothetical protein
MAIRSVGQTGRVQSTSPPPVAPTRRSLGGLIFSASRDFENGGLYKVIGTTKVKGSPDYAVSRRVRLHDQLTGLVVREQWSQAGTGAYAFTRIRRGVFYVVSFDHTGAFNGVIATGVASEAM